ncbi:hypothetical protein [Halostreptopolyspora alba]|uniref:Uncharacterized protein n=1 Tax=Halostreptopolyspora alba TaxID=2487137 RepID=A0A3N0E6Y5_9ACTN|nr:hypothetical protein EFW17_15055 [Nocardiopsaceae bacterium YIM 96095]
MFGFLALVCFGFAYWLDKKVRLKIWGGLLPLLVGVAASMLLYRSQLSITALDWASNIVDPFTDWFGGLVGEPLGAPTVYGVACIIGAAITAVDLYKNHTYNPVAISALVITPVAAHGSAGGWLPALIDALHSWGASVVATGVGATVGG